MTLIGIAFLLSKQKIYHINYLHKVCKNSLHHINGNNRLF